jgi:hypothetical protein
MDLDGVTNLNDFATFAACFNSPPVDACVCSDLTGDGVINLNDFATFAGLFNQLWNGQSSPNCQCSLGLIASSGHPIVMPDTFFTMDHVTGAATPIGTIGTLEGAVADVAVDPTTGTAYGISTCSKLYTINPATGAGTALPNFPGIDCVEGIVFDAAGILYGVSETTDGFFVIDKATGAVTETRVGPPLVTQDGTGLAIDAAGTVYSVTSTKRLRSIDPATGALLSDRAIIDPSGLGRKVTDIAFGNNGLLYGVAKPSGGGTVSDLVILNPATAEIVSTIGSAGANLAGLGRGDCPP